MQVEQELIALRAEIDAIDDEIIHLLQARMQVVKKVGIWKEKNANGLCPIRSGREAKQLRRVFSKMQKTGFNSAAAAYIWRNIINASLALEGSLTIATTENCQMLSREYFGEYTPHLLKESAISTVSDIINKKVDVGVASIKDSAWWLKLSECEGFGAPKVFTCLPFISQQSLAPEAFAFARLIPEESGDDITLAVCEVSPQNAHTTFATSNGKSLVAINGFLNQSDLGSDIKIIGSYATPLRKK